MGWCAIRSFEDAFPTDGRTRERSVQPVPCRRAIRRIIDGVRKLPSERLSRHQQSQSRGGGIPDNLRHLPYHRQLVRRNFQPRDDRVRVNGISHDAAVRAVPRER